MKAEEFQTDEETRIRKRIQFAGFVFLFVSALLREFGVNASLAWIGCGTSAILLTYWFRPRPKETFLRWTIVMEAYLIGSVLGLYVVPKLLVRNLPALVAFIVPALLFGLAIYFMPKNPLYRRKYSLWKWALGCVVVAVTWGLIARVLPFRN